MKYVIVSVVKGKAGSFNDSLRREVGEIFGLRSSTLPAHFTIKAPFDYAGPIDDLKMGLRKFAEQEQAAPYKVEGYDHFDQRVIYMDVSMSQSAKAVHDRLIDVLESYPYIRCDNKDGKEKQFHVTIASKKLSPKYEKVWEYVQQYPCSFACMFDNICLYRLGDSKWILEEEFQLK